MARLWRPRVSPAASINFTGGGVFTGNVWDTGGVGGETTMRPVTRGNTSQPMADNYALATHKRTNKRTDGSGIKNRDFRLISHLGMTRGVSRVLSTNFDSRIC